MIIRHGDNFEKYKLIFLDLSTWDSVFLTPSKKEETNILMYLLQYYF